MTWHVHILYECIISCSFISHVYYSTCTIQYLTSFLLAYLYFTAVFLTKQVDTQNGDLTDTGGHMLATKSKGNSATFYSEFTSENPADLRRLNAGDWFLEGSIDKTRSDMLQVWNDHTDGASEVVDFQFDNVSHSLAVKLSTQQLGATDENDANGTCDVYDNIEVEGVVRMLCA